MINESNDSLPIHPFSEEPKKASQMEILTGKRHVLELAAGVTPVGLHIAGANSDLQVISIEPNFTPEQMRALSEEWRQGNPIPANLSYLNGFPDTLLPQIPESHLTNLAAVVVAFPYPFEIRVDENGRQKSHIENTRDNSCLWIPEALRVLSKDGRLPYALLWGETIDEHMNKQGEGPWDTYGWVSGVMKRMRDQNNQMNIYHVDSSQGLKILPSTSSLHMLGNRPVNGAVILEVNRDKRPSELQPVFGPMWKALTPDYQVDLHDNG